MLKNTDITKNECFPQNRKTKKVEKYFVGHRTIKKSKEMQEKNVILFKFTPKNDVVFDNYFVSNPWKTSKICKNDWNTFFDIQSCSEHNFQVISTFLPYIFAAWDIPIAEIAINMTKSQIWTLFSRGFHDWFPLFSDQKKKELFLVWSSFVEQAPHELRISGVND